MKAAWPLLLLMVLSRGGFVSGRAVSSPQQPLLGDQETESDDTRRVLGSSVVTSVSVIMDLGNGNQAVYADATGRPVAKPDNAAHLASPPHLMSPDRYEFYTFNDAGDLVKRLMTLDEIQSLIAGESVEIGSDLPGIEPDEINHPMDERPPAFFFLPRPVEQSQDWSPPAVDKVVANVQNILASMKESALSANDSEPSWSILPITTHNPQSGLIPTEKIPLLTQLYQISTTSATQKPDIDKIKVTPDLVSTTSEPMKHKPLVIKEPATKRPVTTYEQLSTFIPLLPEKYPSFTKPVTDSPTVKKTTTSVPENKISVQLENNTPTPQTSVLTTEPTVKYTTEKLSKPITATQTSHVSTTPPIATSSPSSFSTFIPVKITHVAKPTPINAGTSYQISSSTTESPNVLSGSVTIPVIPNTFVNETKGINKTEIIDFNKITNSFDAPDQNKPASISHSQPNMDLNQSDPISDNLHSIHQISNTLLEQIITSGHQQVISNSEQSTTQAAPVIKTEGVASLNILKNQDKTGSDKNKTPDSSESTFDEQPFAQSTPAKLGNTFESITQPTKPVTTNKTDAHLETSSMPNEEMQHIQPSTSNDRVESSTASEIQISSSSTPVLSSSVTQNTNNPNIIIQFDMEKDTSLSSSTLATFGQTSVVSPLSPSMLDVTSSLYTHTGSNGISNPAFTTESYTELANSGETTFVPLVTIPNKSNQTAPSYIVTVTNSEYEAPDYGNLPNFGDESEEATSKTTEIDLTSEQSPHKQSYGTVKPSAEPQHIKNLTSISQSAQSVTSHPNELLELLSEITGESSSEEIEHFESTTYPDYGSNTNVPFLSEIHLAVNNTEHNTPVNNGQGIRPEENSEEGSISTLSSMEKITTDFMSHSTSNPILQNVESDYIEYNEQSLPHYGLQNDISQSSATQYSEMPLSSPNYSTQIDNELHNGTTEKITTMIPRSPVKTTITPDVDMNAIAGILQIITGGNANENVSMVAATTRISPTVSSSTMRIDSDDSIENNNNKYNIPHYDKVTTIGYKPIAETLHGILNDEMTKITTFEPNVLPTTSFPEYDIPFDDMIENVDINESINAMKTENSELEHPHVVKKPAASSEDYSKEKVDLISNTEFSIDKSTPSQINSTNVQTNGQSEQMNFTTNLKEKNDHDSTTFVTISSSASNSASSDYTTPSYYLTKVKVNRPGTFITHPHTYNVPIQETSAQYNDKMSTTEMPLVQILSTNTNADISGTESSNNFMQTSQSTTGSKFTENTSKGPFFVKISTLPTDAPIINITSNFENSNSTSGSPLKQQRPVDDDNSVDASALNSGDANTEIIPDLEVSWQEPQEVVWTMVASPTTNEPPNIESQLITKPAKKPANHLNIILNSTNNSSKVEELIVDKILESFMGNEIKTDIPLNISAEKTTAIPEIPEYVPVEESTVRVATLTVPVKSTTPNTPISSIQITTVKKPTELTKPPVADSTSYTKYVPDGDSTVDDMELVSTSNTEYEKLSTIPVRYDAQQTGGIIVSAYGENRPFLMLEPAPVSNLGLEATTVSLDEDIRRFIDLNNDVAIRMFRHVTSELDKRRSIVLSPFGTTSLLAMLFLGARGQTSAQMNDFLPLDDMTTFNPHLVFMNITNSVIMSPDIKAAALVRQLYSQENNNRRLLDFYKARAGAFYDGIVQEVEFNEVSDVVRLRTNELVRTQTSEKVPNFLSNTATLRLRPPLAALSTNVFQMDCHLATMQGKNSEMQFHGELRGRVHTLPSIVWTGQFLVGYDTGLDATAVEIPHSNSPGGAQISTIFIMPGRPEARGSTPLLARLEARLISRRAWSGLLRNLMRTKSVIEVQIPRFEHRSVLNMTVPLRRMGLRDLFAEGRADLRGVNGIQDLYLTDVMQVNAFSACSDPNAEGHVETYPTSRRTGRVGSRVSIADDEDDEPDWRKVAYRLPLALRPRQARIPVAEQNARLRLDRPFLYIVRHNPTGIILHIGRFNPKLMS